MISKKIFPNLIIAGVNKSGTTSLFTYLTAHPDVCGSNRKETCFFLPLRYNQPLPDINDYYEFFEHHIREKIITEATPGYFYGGLNLAKAIKDTCGPIKIIICLRDPAQRLVSFFKRKKEMLELPSYLSLEEYVESCLMLSDENLMDPKYHLYSGVTAGFYSKFLPDWHMVFGDNLKIIFTENLLNNPSRELKILCHWLEIDAGWYDNYHFDIRNKSYWFKSWFIHRIVVDIHDRTYNYFNNHPNLYRKLRKIYNKMNRKPYIKSKKDELFEKSLNYLYADDKRKTRNFLQEINVDNLPGWLRNLT